MEGGAKLIHSILINIRLASYKDNSSRFPWLDLSEKWMKISRNIKFLIIEEETVVVVMEKLSYNRIRH